jgi:hypothetical protein
MDTYQNIRHQIKNLSPEEQLRLLEELATIVRRGLSKKHRRSILELEGLGQEIWQDIDAQDYVNSERSSWSG